MEIDNYKQVALPVTLKQGETLKYTGEKTAALYSRNWKKLCEIDLDTSALTLTTGDHSLTFDCEFVGDEESHAKLEVRFIGPAQKIKGRRSL